MIYKNLPKELEDAFSEFGLDSAVTGGIDLDDASTMISLEDADAAALLERCNASFVEAFENSSSESVSDYYLMVLPPEPWPSPPGGGKKGGGNDGPLTNL